MESWKALAALIGRICLVIPFLRFGMGKIVISGETVHAFHELTIHNMPYPTFFFIGAILLELGGSLSVILGYYTRLGCVLLLIFLIPIILIFQNGFVDPTMMINFMKNISILGGVLVLLAMGPGRYSLDHLRRRRNGRESVS